MGHADRAERASEAAVRVFSRRRRKKGNHEGHEETQRLQNSLCPSCLFVFFVVPLLFKWGGLAMGTSMRRALFACAAAALVIAPAAWISHHAQAAQAQARMVPKFEVDTSWPKLPAKWVFGQVSSISIDENGHAWILQRPSTVRADQKAKGMAAPPVLEFDENGNFLRGWGGPGAGYDWPETEHGIYADPRGFIWIGGNGATDNHLMKFTKDGKFVSQIGKKGASK